MEHNKESTLVLIGLFLSEENLNMILSKIEDNVGWDKIKSGGVKD
jgi:hypothetical protein